MNTTEQNNANTRCEKEIFQHKTYAMSNSSEAALQLLKETSYFSNAPEVFLEHLAVKLDRKQCKGGEILVKEGDAQANIIIIETGVLLRTKLSVSDPSAIDPADLSYDDLLEKSIVIDTLETRGRVSGLLHSFDDTSTAYATVSAQDAATVWLLPKAGLRSVLIDQDCLFLLSSLSKELRSGSKSLRGLLQKQKQDHTSEASGKPLVRVLCYDTANWISDGFHAVLKTFNEKTTDFEIAVDYTTDRLGPRSATYAAGYDAVCVFVNDTASSEVLKTLSQVGVRMIALRCAGFDRVDTEAATAFGFTVARVPAYSPYAVAEMAITLLMSLNRKIVMASSRVKMTNFSLDSSLIGMDIHGKTVGVLGTGKIGGILCDILLGFGVSKLYCYDKFERDDLKQKGGIYVPNAEDMYSECDVIFIMLPLLESTYHTINGKALELMKPGVLLINTSRGGLVDTHALLEALHSGQVGGVGMDVYENEQAYFFQDWSSRHVDDGNLLSLYVCLCALCAISHTNITSSIGHPNVLLTAHQAFFTKEAVGNIVDTTLQNIADFADGKTGLDHPNNCLPVRE